MKKEIKVPAVGESISEGTIAQWTKKSGEFVKRDEVLLVLETDKASVEVVAEADGVLTTSAKPGDVVKIGAVVGEIDTEGKAAAGAGATAAPQASNGNGSAKPSAPPSGAPAKQPVNNPAMTTNPTVSKTETMPPSVRRIVTENKLNPESIAATGKGGRLTKADALGAVASGGGASVSPAPAAGASAVPTRSAGASVSPISLLKTPAARGSLGEEVVREPMTTIRKRIAERLVQAQHTAAILTTFNEIDMSQCMALRAKYKDSFEKKYGIGLGFMGFFVKAVVEALKAFPRVNAFIEGNDVVYHNYYNIGVAVGTEKGLMVPVLKGVEHMSLAEIEMTIKAFANKAREGKISIDDLSGGTFTISNGGVYGSLMSTPILNPPQSGILGMHKIEQRPIAVDGQVVIRPMMYVALSYDHRIIDGGESVSFLVRVKECIEDPSRLLLEI
ncbi:MAG: 2-oxoglutarate dehydrogenase complex dihydrolipoyllysine-residue succinyltransferase [Bdellovibrionales bacterium]|nr:2-oxoglutarate dehydrogenase complex dihydrolipoyllysine-residue succinyltransferase [Bdellovibrionales bacterium]